MDVTIPCPCPPRADGATWHERDTVILRDTLDFRSVTVIRKAIQIVRAEDEEAGAAEILAALTEHYVLSGIEAWTLVDERGKPVEVSKPAIRARLLPHFEAAATVADAADDLYAPLVLLPLLARAQTSSPPMPTDVSTSARTSGPSKRPRPSRPSSTTTTRTDGTGTITPLPVGDSSSSRSLASAR